MGSLMVVNALTLSVTDNGDFLQLRNTTNSLALIHEIRVSQTSTTTLAMNVIRITRGSGGAAGTALTEREYDTAGQTPVVAAFSLPTTDVGSADFIYAGGWNVLQEWVYLPPPEHRIPLKSSQHLSVSLLNSATFTIHCQAVWEEIGA